MAVLSNTGIRAGASGVSDAYQIEKSLRFNGDDDAHLNRTFASGGSVSTWTLSFWIKGADLAQACYVFTGGTGTNSYITMDVGQFRFYSNNHDLKSSARYRDPSAWYHFVCVADTTNGTTADRQRVYVNGERITDWATESNVSGSGWALGDFNSAATHYFNRLTTGSQEDFMLADVHFVDAAAKEPTDFGEANADTGQWLPKKYAGSYGTTGFHLKFDGTDLGEDSAGSNDWTANNLTPASTNLNVPCVDFDNDEDVLLIPDHADLGFGSGDFTVECFINPGTPDSNTYQHIAGQSRGTTANSSSSWAFNLYTQTNGTSQVMFYFYHGANANYANTGYILNSGKWYHIVGTRDGDDLRIYVDGVHQSSIDVSGYAAMNDSAYAFRIGSDDAGSYDLKGSISNLRVVKGTCLYPDGTTFTVPSRPLANVTNTKLLCCQSSTSVKASTVVPYTAPNDGRIWSDATTSNLNFAASGFNNDVGWYAETTAADAIGSITFNPAIPISSITSFKVNAQSNGSNSQNWGFNGGSLTARVCNGATDMTDLLPGSGNLTSMELQKTGSGVAIFNEILINDVVLTDSIAVYGNRNDPTATTISDDPLPEDVSIDTPTTFDDEGNGTGNYCTLNPLHQSFATTTLSNGNLDASIKFTNGSVTPYAVGNFNVSSGKWYWETTITQKSDDTEYIGWMRGNIGSGAWAFADIAAYFSDARKAMGDSPASYGASYGTGDVIGFALDADNGDLTFYKNGVSQGVAATGMTFDSYKPFISANGTSTAQLTSSNFGQRSFKHTPPTGYKALNTYNLPDPTIKDPSKYFDTKLYTGNSWALANTAIDTSTAYRYHRILCEGDNNGGAISEIQFFDSSGLIDASDTNNAGSTVDSNENQNSLDAWTAFNGTLGGADYTEGVRKDPSTGFYISKDWGSGNTKTITSVKIWGVNSYGIAGNTASKYVKLQGSSDDSTWTDLCTWNSGRTDSFSNTSTIPVHVSDQRGIVDGLNFSPDLVWFKQRTGSQYHMVADIVRGGTKQLYPHLSDTETTYANHETTFTSTGVEVSTSNTQNQGGESHLMWAWDGGTANVSKSAGDYNSTTYDTSEDWSASFANGNNDTTDVGQAFRGIIDATGTGLSSTFLSLTDVAFDVTSTISVWVHDAGSNAVSIEYNGTTYTNSSPTKFGWTDFTVPAGSNSGTLKAKLASSSDEIRGVKIDGKILVDSNVTPPNMPSIASTYRANPNTGFSIVTATASSTSGATMSIAHGLNAKPNFIIGKDRENSVAWAVYHSALGATKKLNLSDATTSATNANYWANTEPTSNVLYTKAASWMYPSADTVFYVWSEVAGYSKFGTYIGNADVNGPMVWCGFKPAFLMVKKYDSADNWLIWDNARGPYNENTKKLAANIDDAENSTNLGNDSYNMIDFLSNGFKIRSSASSANGSSNFIFAAFAELPFKYSNAH